MSRLLDLRMVRGEEADGGHRVTVCGKAMIADMSGALYWPAMDSLMLADLDPDAAPGHDRRRAGLALCEPRSTLGRLAMLLERFEPERVIVLGSALLEGHAAHGAWERPRTICDEDSLDLLRTLQEGRQWVWVQSPDGKDVHGQDELPRLPDGLEGAVVDHLLLGGICLRHVPFAGPTTHEIAGGLRPAARIALQSYHLRRPCFVSNGLRLVMPAFGSHKGGRNVLDGAFSSLFAGEGLRIWLLGHEGIYPVAARQLRPEST